MPRVYIDGVEYEARDGANMLEVALENGLDLPYFCWHPAMGSVGSCRLCAVRAFKDEADTKGRIQMACMTPAVDGARVSMKDPEAAELRRFVIEWLMTNHPHDCPVCDEGGECHLQDMTTMCGQVYRRYRGTKRTYNNQYLGPFVTHEMNRCIQCYRCTRFYRDLAGGRDFNVFGSKNRLYFGRGEDGVLESEFSGNLVEVCPTGVFTDKSLSRHYTRKWDLETAPSICAHCAVGCNVIPGARYGEIRRIRARFNSEVNGYFICDRGRYGYEFANLPDRPSRPEMRMGEDGESRQVAWDEALSAARDAIARARGVVGIGSPRASLESNFALRKLVGAQNFSTGLSAFEHEHAQLALRLMREGHARVPSLSAVEHCDAVFILGADVTNEAPMLDFAIRQALRKAPLDIARRLRIPDWDANAIANALQEARGKLHIAAPWRVKLADLTSSFEAATPDEGARMAARVESRLRSVDYDGEDFTERAAIDLRDAAHPLIVTSAAAGANALKAAAALSWTLCEMGKDCGLWIILPEVNTLGVTMLGGGSVDDALAQIESGKADTLIVLENDLSRRADADRLGKAIRRAATVIVLDCLHTAVSTAADVLLPAATHFESDGTFVNSEGRAQRFYSVLAPVGDQRPSWSALAEMMVQPPKWESPGDVLADLAAESVEFAPALEAGESPDWRDAAGRKVARMPHRYTGRTAINADVTMFEPRTPEDPASPFAHTMEGDQDPPGSLLNRYWWPGWNSPNAISKFQIEVGGPLHDGNPGRRLIDTNPDHAHPPPLEIDSPAREDTLLVLRPAIFGSEELSAYSGSISELAPEVELLVAADVAVEHDVSDGDFVELNAGGRGRRFRARVDESLAAGTACLPAGLPETLGLPAVGWVSLRRVK